jgi:hypothetical protein
MGIFKKKPDREKIAFFCNWFIDNNKILIEPMNQKEQILRVFWNQQMRFAGV